MKMKINYIDSEIYLKKDEVFSLEIENRNYFYRIVNDLNNISNTNNTENINFFDLENQEINMNNKIKLFFNYFDFEFNSKKYQTDINKYICNNISDNSKTKLIELYNKLLNSVSSILNDIDIPLAINEEITIETIIKSIKISIKEKQDLFNNLLLVIDLEKLLNTNKILIFINLKQYLTDNQLLELYKYAIYNEVNIILIDSQSYGTTIEYEKKLIIDEDLEEFML